MARLAMTRLCEARRGEARHGAARRSSAGGVTVHLNISTGVAATVRSEIAQMLPAVQRATTAGIAGLVS
jgi:hypothetical protein